MSSTVQGAFRCSGRSNGSAHVSHLNMQLVITLCVCVCYLSFLAVVRVVHEVEGSIRRKIHQRSHFIAVLTLHRDQYN